SDEAKSARQDACELIAANTEVGRSTLIWGVHAPEFGLARWCDADALSVSGILDGVASAQLPTAELGRSAVPIVFAFSVEKTRNIRASEFLPSLKAALCELLGQVPTRAGIAAGLDALSLLEGALSAGTVDPSGLAYSAQRLTQVRKWSSTWLAAV